MGDLYVLKFIFPFFTKLKKPFCSGCRPSPPAHLFGLPQICAEVIQDKDHPATVQISVTVVYVRIHAQD